MVYLCECAVQAGLGVQFVLLHLTDEDEGEREDCDADVDEGDGGAADDADDDDDDDDDEAPWPESEDRLGFLLRLMSHASRPSKRARLSDRDRTPQDAQRAGPEPAADLRARFPGREPSGSQRTQGRRTLWPSTSCT